jgi:tetratricopeptide (TPR) repeat protein
VEAYDTDRGNLRAAMRWLLDHDELADVTRLGLALWQYWWNRSLFEEGIDALETVLARGDVLTDEARGDAGFALGMCRFGLSDYHGSRPIFEEAQTSYRKAEHELGAAMCATPLWTIAALEGHPFAEEAFRDAIEVLRGHRYDWGLAFALFGYGKVLVIAERFEEATPVLEESVRHASRTEVLRSHVLLDLGWARRGTGDLSGSVRAFQEALDRLAAMENPQGMSRVLEGLAAVMLDLDDDEVAGELFGGAEAARRAVGAPVWGVDTLSHVSLEERLRTRLGQARFTLVFERGMRLALDDIISSAHRAAAAVLDG